ncbi:putative NBD/HSP70 family sugar kinase [Catenuloplanes nepalensis]|uniref:NBD/HSP70 family sugar kinase n=1 Tax=Catenuloplanes nepalensis TaxID=587533 RepID=A0ABT9N7V5_9ACTN|nr:ROK family transcriptional regulator [Catenuloplanes nepalensis]MDP9799781.1 putative NBD/HSP70 family sugar kinase [Catenuloplanes nepalensis]
MISGISAAGTPVRQASLRQHNLRLVLAQIALSSPQSRADVASATGLTRATVSTLVDDLVSGRLLREVSPAPRTGAGRPGVGLVLNDADGPAGLGLEINVDYLAACVLDLSGAVRHREIQAGDRRGVSPALVLSTTASLAARAHAAAQDQGLTIAGTAVAVPGLVSPDGTIRLAPNLGWREVNTSGFTPGPLTVENEANLAALGELHYGSPSGSSSFLYVSGEIGIGAGIVLDGSLFRGARGWSGELGHVAVHPDGPACRCGARGCLEQYAGQEALLPPGRSVDDLAAAALSGDAAALDRLSAAASALGVTIAGVINLLDVDTVVLGGIYAPLAPWLSPGIEAQIASRVLTASWSPVRVRAAGLGSDAAVIGAAGAIIRAVHEEPAAWLTETSPSTP